MLETIKLDKVAIIGVGLLGGSIGLALRAAGFSGQRVGIGRRASSLRKALDCDAVDEVTQDVAKGVGDAQLVVLCTPIGHFETLLRQLGPALSPGTYVTDVASTKTTVVQIAHRLLPKTVRFVGSHPMAGSEKMGVEFARADLFERALCVLTPTPRTDPSTIRWMRSFWETLGAHTATVTPKQHDILLARVSHLPHAVATALVQLSLRGSAIDFAGPGFADVTRIASGDPNMWTDIFRTNRKAMMQGIDQLITELTKLRGRLERDDEKAIHDWLEAGKNARDQWIAKRYKQKKVLPP